MTKVKKVKKFGIGKFLVMALVFSGGLIYGTQMVQQNQDNRSDAATKITQVCKCSKSIYKSKSLCEKAKGKWTCTSVKPKCTSYTYSPWSKCKNGKQSRWAIKAFPEGCDAGNLSLIFTVRDCPKCTAYTYGPWSKCKNGMNVKVAVKAYPEGCDSDLSSVIVMRSCPECTSYTYTPWSDCKNGVQMRMVTGASPEGCNSDLNLADLVQICN